MSERESRQEGVRGALSLVGVGASAAIPDKLYFRIGEVASLCGVATSVLRFWEGEFTQLKPKKGGNGQRSYRRRDVEMALRIKELLYGRGMTILGARRALHADSGPDEPQLSLSIVENEGSRPQDRQGLRRLKGELEDLATLLTKAPGRQAKVLRAVRAAPRVPELFD